MDNILNLAKDADILDLAKAAPSLTRLKGTLNWDMHPVHGASLASGFDLDIFLFCLNSAGKVAYPNDVCFYNNKSLFSGAVAVPKDNRTGADDGGDDEFFVADLPKVPVDKDAIDVYVFIHDAAARGQNFGMMSNAKFVLKDDTTGAEIQAYAVNQFTTGSCLHVGRVKRNGTGWNFEPVGEAADANPNQVVRAYM